MIAPSQDTLHGGQRPASIGLDLSLGLALAPLPASWETQIEQWMQANQALLVGLAALDAGGGELAHEFDATRQSDRIEAKLNLTLHLLARFMAAQCPQPAAQPVTLYTDRLVWQGQPPQSIDDEQLLMLYLSAQIPEPLRLPVRIAACNPANDNTWRIDAEFQHLSDPVADWLARTIFRYHRRQIQAHRKSTQPGTAL